MTDLLQLATEVEAGTAPDREMDARVWCALHDGFEPWPIFAGATRRVGSTTGTGSPLCTASVDAALALFRQKLPGWQIQLFEDSGPITQCSACIWPKHHEDWGSLQVCAEAPAIPRAIVAAVLRGVAAR